ncbi:MAG TPA: hypothetical protein VIA06_08075 [Candidatus Dormibacteraeota bacterium]|nr:hypothetical protein [Candidatus Dormibacteraeota bacterium]
MSSLSILDLALVAVVGVFAVIAALNTNQLMARTRRIEAKFDHALRQFGALDPSLPAFTPLGAPLAPAPADMASVQESLLRGRTIEAIKRYREATGVDLRTAKRAVDELRAGMPPQP